MDYSVSGYPPGWQGGGAWMGWQPPPTPYWPGPGMYDPSFDPCMLDPSYLTWQHPREMHGVQPSSGTQAKRRPAPKSKQPAKAALPAPLMESDTKKDTADDPTVAAEIQRLKELLAGAKEKHLEAFDALHGNVWKYSLYSQDACCVVQDALEAANVDTLRKFVQELHGHVPEAAESPNGNHVLQKIIEVCSFAEAAFIAEEILPRSLHVSRNRYGCRILCRLLEQKSWDHKCMGLLVEALLKKVCELSRHPFGQHVIQSLIENGNAEQKKRVARGFYKEFHRHSTNRTASHVLEKVFFFCGEEERRALARELFNEDGKVDAEKIDELAQNQSGCRTLKAVVDAAIEESAQVLFYIEQNMSRIQGNKWGRKMAEEWATSGKIKLADVAKA